MNKKNENLDYEKLASIVADLTTDGHIQIRNKSGVISFYSKEYSEIEKFNSIFKSLFNKKGNIFKDEREGNIRYKLFISYTKIARFLKMKGVPVGNKTNISFNVPNWIMDGSENVKKIYLQRLFDAEGSIFKCSDGRWHITFTMNKNESLLNDGLSFFKEIRLLLNQFQIKTYGTRVQTGTLRKDRSRSKCLKMEIRKEYFQIFYENINFLNSRKRDKLKLAIKEIY